MSTEILDMGVYPVTQSSSPHNCQCLAHPDRERMRFYPEPDRSAALDQSALRLAERENADSAVRAVPNGGV